MRSIKNDNLSSSEYVIVVDESDQEIGIEEKLKAHQLGLLHRAFSVCVTRYKARKTELLLQQRAATKYHSANLWTNTCCSHPKIGETILQAAKRRLKEEMGFTIELITVDQFIYKAELSNGLIEHELDHLLLAEAKESIQPYPDPEEVQDYRWQTLVSLEQDLRETPEKYSTWLPMVVGRLVNHFNT